jgi:hypothetical protein
MAVWLGAVLKEGNPVKEQFGFFQFSFTGGQEFFCIGRKPGVRGIFIRVRAMVTQSRRDKEH